MPVVLSQEMMRLLPELRVQPVPKRLTVRLGPELVARTDRPVLVMEPMRVVPSYAVPVADLRVAARAGAGRPAAGVQAGRLRRRPAAAGPVACRSRSTPPTATPVQVRVGDRTGAGFRPHDLADHVILDFDDFDWWEEDEPLFGHPRDPFHRIDVRRSSRRVRISHEGTVLADSRRPWALFEGVLPAAAVVPPARGRRRRAAPERAPHDLRLQGPRHPLRRGRATGRGSRTSRGPTRSRSTTPRDVAGCVAFYQERLDVEIDGDARRTGADALVGLSRSVGSMPADRARRPPSGPRC